MHKLLAVGIVLVLAACGGSSSSSSSGGSASGGGSGSETPVASGEDEGFDDAGGTDAQPEINHGSQSAHQLIGVHPPPTPWANMSASERNDYMIYVLLPVEAESFAQWAHSSGQGDRFAQFECENCHGDNAEAQHFAMPSRSLLALAAPGSPQWEQMSRGPAFAFMQETVVPEVATMLGVQPYSAQHQDGFGCFGCHPHAQ